MSTPSVAVTSDGFRQAAHNSHAIVKSAAHKAGHSTAEPIPRTTPMTSASEYGSAKAASPIIPLTNAAFRIEYGETATKVATNTLTMMNADHTTPSPYFHRRSPFQGHGLMAIRPATTPPARAATVNNASRL